MAIPENDFRARLLMQESRGEVEENVPKIHSIASSRSTWCGKNIAVACPTLLPACTALIKVPVLPLDEKETRELIDDLKQILEGIADDPAARQIKDKVHELYARVIQLDAQEQRKEFRVPARQFTDIAMMLRFLENHAQEAAKKAYGPQTVAAIKKVILENIGLLQSGAPAFNSEEVARRQEVKFEVLDKLKAIDRTLYKEILIRYIQIGEVSLGSLFESVMSDEELLDIAPHVRYVYLYGPYKRTNEFLEQFLQRATHCTRLHVTNIHDFAGVTLAKLKRPEILQTLHVSMCPKFTHPLPHLPRLESLWIDCPGFDFSKQPFQPTAGFVNGCVIPRDKVRRAALQNDPIFMQQLNNFLGVVAAGNQKLPIDWGELFGFYSSKFPYVIDPLIQRFPDSHFALAASLYLAASNRLQLDALCDSLKEKNRIVEGLSLMRKMGIFQFEDAVVQLKQNNAEQILRELAAKDKHLRLEFLSLLPPDMIHKTFYEFSEEERENWLDSSGPGSDSRHELTLAPSLGVHDHIALFAGTETFKRILPLVPLDTFLACMAMLPQEEHPKVLAQATTKQREEYNARKIIPMRI